MAFRAWRFVDGERYPRFLGLLFTEVKYLWRAGSCSITSLSSMRLSSLLLQLGFA